MLKSLTFLFCCFLIGSLLSPLVISTTSYVENVEEENEWHFIALGDMRNLGPNENNPVRAGITNHVVFNNPNAEFVLNSGDLVYYGAEQDDWDRYYEDVENATKNNVTYYHAVGNHERYSYNVGGSYGPIEYNCSTYMSNVELPGNERFYSFDHNEIHFVFINTEEDWLDSSREFDITTEQETWLRDDLQNHTDDFIVAVFHRPLYSIRSSSRVEDAQAIRSVLSPIFIEYDVDLTISGHDHYYYRTFRDNIMYVVTGGSGANLATNGDTTEWNDGDVFHSVYHYMNLTVRNSNIEVETLEWNEITQEVSIIDSFKLSLVLDNSSVTTTSTNGSTTETSKTTNIQYFMLLPLLYLLVKRKKERTKQEILMIANKFFSEKTLNKVSVEDIAQAAFVSRITD